MKTLIRKIFITIASVLLITIGTINITNADSRYEADEGYGNNLGSKVEGVGTIGTTSADTTDASILDVIQRAINRVLGMLSFVALILCLRGGFQMLIAGGDDAKVKAGTKVLKNAAIGLAVIGLAWLVVSFVFRIINKVSNNTP